MPGPIYDIDHLHRRGRHQLLKGYWNIYEHSLVLVNVAQALAFFIAKLVFQSTSSPGYTPPLTICEVLKLQLKDKNSLDPDLCNV